MINSTFIPVHKENNFNQIARAGLLAPIEHVPKMQGLRDLKEDQPKQLIRTGLLQPIPQPIQMRSVRVLSQALPKIQELSESQEDQAIQSIQVGLALSLSPPAPKIQKFEDLKGAKLKEAVRVWLLQPASKIQGWNGLKKGRAEQIEVPLTSKPRARADSLSIDTFKYMPSIHKDTFISSRKDFTHILLEESSNRSGFMIRPCKRSQGSFYDVAVTHSKAMKFFKPPVKPGLQKRGENIADKIRLGNEEIGLKTHRSTPLDLKKFGVINPKTEEFHEMGKFGGVLEEAFLGDCNEIKISSKKELFSFFACVIHQVDVLHKANIAHMDIKEGNICKTKEDLFQIIDKESSLDFDDNALEEIRGVKFGFTPAKVSPNMFHDLQKANTLEEAKQIAKRVDIFTIGTVFYQMTHALKMKKSVRECRISPYVLEKQEFIKIESGEFLKKRWFAAPIILKAEEELDETLVIIDDSHQRILIKRMLSFKLEEQPTIEELKMAFPTSLIVKKAGT